MYPEKKTRYLSPYLQKVLVGRTTQIIERTSWLVDPFCSIRELEQTPPDKSRLTEILGPVEAVPDQALSACLDCHQELINCLYRAADLRALMEGAESLSKTFSRIFCRIHAERYWIRFAVDFRDTVPAAYFQTLIPDINILMKTLKYQRRLGMGKIKLP